MIKGVKIISKQKISDERGQILHMLKNTDKEFEKFGEIYFSTAFPGVIKGFHQHKSMTLNLFVVSGSIKLVMFYAFSNEFYEYFLGEWGENSLVSIPPKVWSGYKNYGDKVAIVANCATEPHSKEEILYLDPHGCNLPGIINYDWSRKDE